MNPIACEDRSQTERAGSFHVLVAEDDAAVRRSIAAGLSRDGFRVTIARSGLEFFDLLEAVIGGRLEALDLIVSDNRLPGFTGLEVISVLRDLGWETPVIFLATAGDEEAHAEAQRLGAAAVFDKPVSLDEVRAAACVLFDLGDPLEPASILEVGTDLEADLGA